MKGSKHGVKMPSDRYTKKTHHVKGKKAPLKHSHFKKN